MSDQGQSQQRRSRECCLQPTAAYLHRIDSASLRGTSRHRLSVCRPSCGIFLRPLLADRRRWYLQFESGYGKAKAPFTGYSRVQFAHYSEWFLFDDYFACSSFKKAWVGCRFDFELESYACEECI